MLKHPPPLPGLFRVACKQFSRLRGIAVIALLTVGFVLTYFLMATPLAANAATNSTLNFQARLETAAGAIVPDGNYDIVFRIYNASSSAGYSDSGTPSCGTDTNCLWDENYTYNSGAGGTDARLHVANGYLTVNLGSLTAFPSTINWDQPLWLSMDVGGTTSSGAITWDGPMSPRLALTAVPYAFRAGSLATGNGTNSSTLTLIQPASSTQVFQVPDQGSAGTYNLLTGGSVAGAIAGVVLQSSTPGTVQTGNFNVSGTGVVGTTLQTPTIDTPSGTGTLNIGKASGGNASLIQLNLNTQLGTGTILSATPHFLYISEGSSNATGNADITGDWASPNNWGIGSNSNSASDRTIRMGVTTTNGGNTWSTTANLNVLIAGTEKVQPTTGNDSTTAFQVQTAGGNNLLTVDSTNTQVNTYGDSLNVNGIADTAAPTLTTASTGGTLTAGTYSYALSAQDATGRTTLAVDSSPTSVTTSGSTSKNTLTWATVANAAGYVVYRSTDGGNTWSYDSLSAATSTLVDTGSVTWTSGANPNFNFNDTGGVNLQSGTTLTLDSGTGNNNSYLGYLPNYNYTVLANANSGGGLYLQSSYLWFRDTTTYNPDFILDSNGSAVFDNNTNSTTAFQIQNASAEPLLNIDTTNPNNLISNPDAATGTTGWTATGTGASVARNTNTADIYSGLTSIKDVTGTTANGGAEVTGFTTALTPGTYSLSFYAATASGSFGDLAVNIVGGGAPTCTTSSTTNSPSTSVGTGFNNYFCTFTSTGTNVTGIIIGESGTTSHTFYLGGVQLVTGSTPAYDYTNGTLQILGNVASPMTFQNTNNTNNAFQINRQSGQTIFSVDTAANHVMAGSVSACEDVTLTGQFCVGQNVTNTGSFANNKNVMNITGTGGSTDTGMQIVLDDTGTGADTVKGIVVDSTSGNSGGGSSNTAATINSFVANVPSANPGSLLQLQSSSTNVFTVNNLGATAISENNSTQTDNTLGLTANNLTTGNALSIASSSAIQTAGSLFNMADTATLATNGGSLSGSMVNVSRSLTANTGASGGTSPSYDNSKEANTSSAGVSSTWSNAFTVGSNANRYLIVGVSDFNCNQPTAITYAGTAMTLVGSNTSNTTGCAFYYGLIAPSSGTNFIQITPSATGDIMEIIASSWYNVNQSTPYGSFTTNFNNASSTASLTATSASGQVVVDFLSGPTTGNGTASASQTLAAYQNSNSVGLGIEAGSSYKTAVGATTAMGWTSLPASKWSESAVGLKGAGSATSETVSAAVASFSNSCSITTGTCSDATNVLNLNQQYSNATGAVLNIQNAGNGDMIDLSNGSGTVLDSFSNNGTLTIGAPGGSTTPALLVLGTQTSGSAPTEVDGAIYYNASSKSFRCGQNSAWVACDGQVYAATSSSSTVNSVGTGVAFSTDYTLPANDCQAGVSYIISAGGHLTIAHAADNVRFYVYEGTTLAQTHKMEPTTTTGTFFWTANITVTCVSATTAVMNGPISIEGNNADSVTSFSGSYDVLTTNGGPLTWSSSAGPFGLAANITTGGSSSDSIVMDQIVIQRLGP